MPKIKIPHILIYETEKLNVLIIFNCQNDIIHIFSHLLDDPMSSTFNVIVYALGNLYR